MSNDHRRQSEPNETPLTAVVREQVLSRLREATQLTESNLGPEIVRVTELLTDANERLGALELVLATDAAPPPTMPHAFLRTAVPADHAGEPVSEFLLIPFGDVEVERPAVGESFSFTREHAESAVRWFDALGRKLAIDYEHQTFDRFNTRPDGLRPAAGWIGALEIRDDGLWATDVTWTHRARELLRQGEYRYFSPVIFWTDEERQSIAALGPVALTNDPAMRNVPALAARRSGFEGAPDPDTPNDDDVPADDISPDDGTDEFDDLPNFTDELTSAEAEIAVLKRQLAEERADAFIAAGLRAGKIVASTRDDWRTDFLRDAEIAEARLERAPVVLPPGRVLQLDPRGTPAPLERSAALYRRHSATIQRWGIDPEDLAAYDRANAEGRIK